MNLPKQHKKGIEETVRDICAVPVTKSKTRRLIIAHTINIIDSLIEEMEKSELHYKVAEVWSPPMCDNESCTASSAYNQALQDQISKLQQYKEELLDKEK